MLRRPRFRRFLFGWTVLALIEGVGAISLDLRLPNRFGADLPGDVCLVLSLAISLAAQWVVWDWP